MDATNPHNPEREPRTPSCTSCRSRKIRCDKTRPRCGGCARSNLPCEFPTLSRRAPRPRRDVLLLQRLQRLESVIEELSGAGGREKGGSEERPLENRGGVTARGTPEEEVEAGLGRLLISDDGRSQYFGPSFWASLSGEVADLKSLLDEPMSGSPETPTYPISPLSVSGEPPSFLFGSSLDDLSMFYPTEAESAGLYSIFLTSVDPLVRIVHKPTFESKLNLHRSGVLDRGFEALVFAVYYSAVFSLQADKVPELFGSDKSTLLNRYRCGLEHALANARFLQGEELTTLQAFVLFITCLRNFEESRTAWILAGVAVRIAQSMGLHRDGTLFNIPPLETEMRRRVWYEICILDLRTAEDFGLDPSISTQSYDTLLPLNIQDSDILPSSVAPIAPRSGFTEMTFPLLRFECLDCFRYVAESTRGVVKMKGKGGAGNEQASLEEKEKLLDELSVRLREKYLAGIDLEQPIQRVTYMVSKMTVWTALLSLYHPIRHFKHGQLLSQEKKDKLFQIAIETIEYSGWFKTHPTRARYTPWNWLSHKYPQAQAAALVLFELTVRPASGLLVDRAWAALDVILDPALWSSNGDRTLHVTERVWKPLEKLREKALKRRRGMAVEGREEEESAWGAAPEEGCEGSVPVEFDWNEWDEMFQYVRMDIE